MVNYTCMYMVYAVCKHARVHVLTVHTIYTQPHMCTDRHTHTHTHTHTCTHIDIHTIILAVIINIVENKYSPQNMC